MAILKISIIVPVYNSSEYLPECLNSIINQSFQDYEVLLINDGSTDSSLNICHKYAEKDSRFRVFDKVNGGVSNTRNLGIKEAKGELIAFNDSDDLIAQDYFKVLVETLGEDNDLVMSGMLFFDTNTNDIFQKETLDDNNYDLSISDDCFRLATATLITSTQSKLFRTNIIRENNLFFDESLCYGEDRDFNLKYIAHCTRVISTSYSAYYYRKGLSSNLSNKKDYLKHLDIDLTYWQDLKSYLDKNHCDNHETTKYLANRLFNIYNDRFTQILSYDNSYTIYQNVFREYLYRNPYNWLIENIKHINFNKIIKFLYRHRCSRILTVYLGH